MPTIQAFSPYGLDMNVADALGVNFDAEPLAFSSTSLILPTFDGGTFHITGSGFGGFESDNDASLTGTVTDLARFDGGGGALFSVSGMAMPLSTFAAATNLDFVPDLGLSFFSFLNSGADNITGADGQRDNLFGFDGNDTLNGLGGDDILYGNKNDDFVAGGEGNDTVYGGQQNDFVFGENGNDVVYGNFNPDAVYGGAGDDTIYGGQGDDQMFGETGNDVLIGNRGSDVITGGAGADQFVFGFSQGQGTDTIVDFNSAEDVITVNDAINTGTIITYDAGADAMVIVSTSQFEQGQLLRQPDGSTIIEQPSTGQNFIIISGGDFTGEVGTSIFLL